MRKYQGIPWGSDQQNFTFLGNLTDFFDRTLDSLDGNSRRNHVNFKARPGDFSHIFVTHLISSQSLNLGGRRGTADDVATITFHPSLCYEMD